MATQWFRVPAVSITDGGFTRQRPKYADQADSFAGNIIEDSPVFVVRMRADQPTLDSIGGEPDATPLTPSEASNLFNSSGGANVSAPDMPWDATDVNEHFIP